MLQDKYTINFNNNNKKKYTSYANSQVKIIGNADKFEIITCSPTRRTRPRSHSVVGIERRKKNSLKVIIWAVVNKGKKLWVDEEHQKEHQHSQPNRRPRETQTTITTETEEESQRKERKQYRKINKNSWIRPGMNNTNGGTGNKNSKSKPTLNKPGRTA